MARRKRDSGIPLNFAGVEGRVLVPEGDYRAKVKAVELKDGNAAQYLAWTFTTISDNPKLDGKSLFYNTSLAAQSLWNLRNLLETLGVEIPDGPMDLEVDELIDLELNLRVEHEEHEGKDRARVTDFSMIDEDEEEEAPKKGKKKDKEVEEPKKSKKSKKDEEEDEDEDDDEDEEEEEASVEGDEDEDDLDKLSEDEVGDMDADELADVVKKYDLKVNLKILKTAKKKVAAVIDALEEAGYLEG